MEVYEAIHKRFSVRAYEDKPVEQDKLMRVLDAARLAPSANNRQVRKIIVVRDAEFRAKLAELSEQPFVGQAPVILVIVTSEPDRIMSCEVPGAPVDCAIAIDHMTLAAVAEGLGTCWVGHFNQEECKKLLEIPADHQIIELLPMGYPAVNQPPQTRKNIEEVICWDTFRAVHE